MFSFNKAQEFAGQNYLKLHKISLLLFSYPLLNINGSLSLSGVYNNTNQLVIFGVLLVSVKMPFEWLCYSSTATAVGFILTQHCAEISARLDQLPMQIMR